MCVEKYILICKLEAYVVVRLSAMYHFYQSILLNNGLILWNFPVYLISTYIGVFNYKLNSRLRVSLVIADTIRSEFGGF